MGAAPPAREELVARARALAPALRARAAEAERLRRVPDADGQRVTVTVRFSAVCNAPSPATARST